VEYVRLAVAVIPAAAITYGEPDGSSHPQVGLLIFDVNGVPAWFDADAFAGGPGIEFSAINTHPNFNDNAFYLHDAGVVILSEPVYGVSYGSLSAAGVLDELAPHGYPVSMLRVGQDEPCIPAERPPDLPTKILGTRKQHPY
jgi:hypothetical protein